MNKYRLSFARINIISANLVEIIIDNETLVSLEMVEELDKFLDNSFNFSFGLLINKVNGYTYSFEAMMTMASLENIQAIAVINYTKHGEDVTDEIIKRRKIDQLNIKSFSALELGYQRALTWLQNQLVCV